MRTATARSENPRHQKQRIRRELETLVNATDFRRPFSDWARGVAADCALQAWTELQDGDDLFYIPPKILALLRLIIIHNRDELRGFALEIEQNFTESNDPIADLRNDCLNRGDVDSYRWLRDHLDKTVVKEHLPLVTLIHNYQAY